MSIPMRSIRCCWTFDIHERHRRRGSAGRCSSPTHRRPLTAPGSWDFFQIDKNTGDAKGIVAIDLGAL